MSNEKHPVEQIAEACGGTITSGGILPDGSGFATVSFPLSKNHWIYGREDPLYDAPPMVFKMGSGAPDAVLTIDADTYSMNRQEFAEKIREAGKYAVRASTMHGAEMDFDPDALLQNLVVGMLGYWTENGLSGSDDWANPVRFRDPAKEPHE